MSQLLAEPCPVKEASASAAGSAPTISINWADKEGQTALHLAADNGHVESTRLMPPLTLALTLALTLTLTLTLTLSLTLILTLTPTLTLTLP